MYNILSLRNRVALIKMKLKINEKYEKKNINFKNLDLNIYVNLIGMIKIKNIKNYE
jgi:hypothetical protein